MKNTHVTAALQRKGNHVPLTRQHLAAKVSGRETLGHFISARCGQPKDPLPLIYHTSALEHFSFLENNRPLNEAHVLSLVDSFIKDGYLFTVLYVNERLQVIDGQHRFEAAKRLGLAINFIVMPGWGISEVAILNVNSRNWTIHDFLESYARSGNRNYIRFKQFCDQYRFEVTTSQLLVTGSRSGRRAANDVFRLGQLRVTDEQIRSAREKADKISEMQLFHPLGWRSRNFVEAMLFLFGIPNYEHECLLQKLRDYPDVLLSKSRSLRVEEYLSLLKDKYNHRRANNRISISR